MLVMLAYLWPLLLIVVSNIFYNITVKETPGNVSPFLSLVVTYLAGAVISFCIYLATAEKHQILQNLKQLNWTSYVLGIAIVGLEAGYIYLYRAGWQISLGSLAANITLAVSLILVGALLYKETIHVNQGIGIMLCLAGLVFINIK